jgi:hypothetical protein
MIPDETSASPTPPEPIPAPETPQVEALLRHYRSRAQARRQRRLRRWLIAGGGLLGGGALVIGVLSVVPRAREETVAPPPDSAPPAGPPSRAAPEGPAPERPAPEARAPAPATTKVSPPPRLPATSPEAPPPSPVTMRYQPPDRLTAVRTGDTKERVFDLFGSTVEREGATLVRIDGMRLRAKGRSPDHPQVEVADVEVAEGGQGQRYWFLFGEGYLLAWGRPDEWSVAAARYQLEVDYR